MQGSRTLRFVISIAAGLIGESWLCAAALAADGPAPSVGTSCMEVEVNGQRAPSFSCLTQKLRPDTNATNKRPSATLTSEAITARTSNQLALFNFAATSHRMGNTFGTSVHPQRPAPIAPTAPTIPRP